MGYVSHKLKTPLQGALAGGGDPATSPLYVFGPFLRLIVAAGVAKVTFGASIWLVIFTIAMVSAMYRLVMRWITDGSGGSGLSEEEFGSWAVKTTAGITFIEYTLTFLVSMAALVTFVADRFPRLNEADVLIENRAWLAIAMSVLTGWLVNRGPKTTARAFGPATAAVLVLLWVMMAATIWKTGFHLPTIDMRAFTPTYWGDTFAGYARILAVMTGIEIFANMVAAYEGPPEQRSRKAFQGLVIVMGTTGLTMLIVGPAIFSIADPFDEEVSVFTQTMDELLPGVLSEIGTIVGVAVLLSASAASALGLQNLFVGLKLRNYVPATLGRLNRFGVADRPVWIQVAIAVFAFLIFGTDEETYLALYAAGVFILLAMTGWAATKRLLRGQRESRSAHGVLVLVGAMIAAILTTGATLIIFIERFTEGAWTYLLFIPALYVVFTYFRVSLGPPSLVQDRIGSAMTGSPLSDSDSALWQSEAIRGVRHVFVPVDGSDTAAASVPLAAGIARALNAELSCAAVVDGDFQASIAGVPVERLDRDGSVATTLCRHVHHNEIDLIVIATRGQQGIRRAVLGSTTAGVVAGAHRPVLVLPPATLGLSMFALPRRILVPLDGSLVSERSLAYAQFVAQATGAELVLAHVVESIDEDTAVMTDYLNRVAAGLHDQGLHATIVFGGQDTAAAISAMARDEDADMIFMATHGRGGLSRAVIGSVADSVIRSSDVAVLLVPIIELKATRPQAPVTAS